jgi:hypothetical protein
MRDFGGAGPTKVELVCLGLEGVSVSKEATIGWLRRPPDFETEVLKRSSSIESLRAFWVGKI